jgi:Xaa-Pro aminopeptidase
LTTGEKAWLNEYHAEVLGKVLPLLEKSGDARAMRWLKRECTAI